MFRITVQNREYKILFYTLYKQKSTELVSFKQEIILSRIILKKRN